MTVAELIAELQEFNPDAIVLTEHNKDGYFSEGIDFIGYSVREIEGIDDTYVFDRDGLDAVIIC